MLLLPEDQDIRRYVLRYISADIVDSLTEGKDSWIYVLVTLLSVLAVVLITWLAIRINKRVFMKIKARRKEMQFYFFEKVSSVIIVAIGVFLVLIIFNGMESLGRTLLGGTAIISAVAAFVAQDAIKDVLAGLMMSIYKPFEIGSRIELEDKTVGIVKDISMRHVVLQGIDNKCIIIPNSKINAMKVVNYTYLKTYHSMVMEFFVSYDTDTKKASEVIRKAVMESPFSIPKKDVKDGDYGQVYFSEYGESSLKLVTSVYYEVTSPTEKVRDDINTRVKEALAANGIEIPYPYVNIVNKKV